MICLTKYFWHKIIKFCSRTIWSHKERFEGDIFSPLEVLKISDRRFRLTYLFVAEMYWVHHKLGIICSSIEIPE